MKYELTFDTYSLSCTDKTFRKSFESSRTDRWHHKTDQDDHTE